MELFLIFQIHTITSTTYYIWTSIIEIISVMMKLRRRTFLVFLMFLCYFPPSYSNIIYTKSIVRLLFEKSSNPINLKCSISKFFVLVWFLDFRGASWRVCEGDQSVEPSSISQSESQVQRTDRRLKVSPKKRIWKKILVIRLTNTVKT